MISQVSLDAFKIIFPRYSELLEGDNLSRNQPIQSFLRDQLPRKVELVRGMEYAFNSFLTHFTSIIIKRPPHSNLVYSILLKVGDKIDKLFNSLSSISLKTKISDFKVARPDMDIQNLKKQFRSKLQRSNDLLKDKFFGGNVLQKQVEEEITLRLYVLLQIYHFLKGDPVNIAGKFRFRQDQVLYSINKNQIPNQIGSLMILETNFFPQLEENIQKRCRPFSNKRQLLQSKVRQVLRQTDSKVGFNIQIMLQSIISKERARVSRQLSSNLTRQMKQFSEDETQSQTTQIISQVQLLKRQFGQLKNNMYFLDLMRGNFSQKYKMQINKLQNIFYLTNLQKYLQDVSTFLEKVLQLEQRIIKNRRDYMRNFGNQFQDKITNIIYLYKNKYPETTNLSDLINDQFSLLESALYGVINNNKYVPTSQSSIGVSRSNYEDQRKRKMEDRAEEERRKRQIQKQNYQDKKKKQEERMLVAKLQRQQKEKKKKQQAQRLQYQRKQQFQKRRQQKQKKDDEIRKQYQQQQRKKDQQKKRKEEQDKINRQQLNKKKSQQQAKKIRQRQQQNRKRQLERKAILQRQQRDKKQRENQFKEKQKKQEEERKKRQNQKKLEEERIKKQKAQKELQQIKREQERIKLQKQKKIAQEKRKEQQRLKLLKQKQQRDKKAEQQKRQRQQQTKAERQKRQRQQRLKKQKQQAQARQKRQKQQRQKKQKQRKQRQEKQQKEKKEKLQKQKRQQKQKQEKERERRQKQQKLRKEKEEAEKKQRQQRQKKEKQAKQKKEKQEKQRLEKQKKQKERLQKQKQEKEKQQKERIQKQKQEKQKRQKERLQKQRQEKEREQKEKQQKQRKQRQLKEEEQRKKQLALKKQAEQKAKKQKQIRQENERKAQQIKKRQLEEKTKKEQEQKLKATKKEQPKKGNAAEPKKGSAINYGDFDDIMDDDLEQMEKAGQLSPSGINSKIKADQDQYDVDDFEDQSPNKQGQIQTKQLISLQDIKCLNQYMKGTSYMRKNKVNPEFLNKNSTYLLLFQELVQNRRLFFFQAAIGKAVIDLGQQLTNPDTNQEDLKMSVQTIKEQMMRLYDQIFQGEQMSMNTRFILPISFNNQYKIKVIQMIPALCYFNVIFEEALPEDQDIQSRFQGIIQALLYIFELEGQPQLEDTVLNQQTRLVLGTFDKELPCLLLIFAMHYQRIAGKQLLVNQYTIERFFYTTHIIEPLYDSMKDGEEIDQFFNKLAEKYSSNDKIKICSISVNSSDQQYSQKLTHSAIAIKQQFVKGKQNTLLANFSVEIQDESGQVAEKIVVYLSLEKASPKPTINYYLITKDPEQQDNASLIFDLIAEGDQNFEVTVYTDFSRHNCLSSYSDWSLPLWAHVITKRKLSVIKAIRSMCFSMTPYYLSFKQMD